MARKSKKDVAAAKAAKQKKILIVGSVLFVLIAAIQVPRMMKQLNKKPKPPIASAVSTTPGTTTPTAAPTDPNSLAAPTLGGSTPVATPATTDTTASSSDLVSAVPVSADPGQLETFERFATKDPFAQQAGSTGSKPSSSGSGAGSGSSTTPTITVSTPPPSSGSGSGSTSGSTPPPAVTTGVISINGEAGPVQVGADFPTAGTVFTRVGAIFHLVSLTAKTAKIAIAGGSYANGAPTITLNVGKPVTLQNTADGTKYTLILEPQGTATATTTTGTSTTPTSTTPVVPSGSGG